HFSFGFGASSPQALVDAAIARGFRTLACTDTNGVYGAVEFQQAAESAGIRPILGAHLRFGDQDAIALATDEKGWGALCRAITHIHWSAGNETGVPPLHIMERGPGGEVKRRDSGAAGLRGSDSASLAETVALDRDGLVLLSRSVAFLDRVQALSGPTDLYAELVPGRERHGVLAAARRMGLPAVASNAVAFANPEDWARHRLLVAIGQNTTLVALEQPAALPRGPAASPSSAWLRHTDDLAHAFPDCPEALTAAEEIADRCRWRIPLGRVVPPRMTDRTDAFEQLRALAYAGAERRYGTVAPVTRDRLEHELAIIGMKGFADYFLVVHDIVAHGPTHCGRGSVANSVVSYCLGITHVEPLGAGLLFERFLNPARTDPPDIDLDFPWDERDRVLAYVFRRYPFPRAAMVSNHNCFRLRGALREVAKVHGRPAGEIREVTRRIPWYHEGEPLDSLLATHPNFQGLDLPKAWQGFAREAEPLVGVPRHLSLHPGGVVIVPTALTDHVPLERAVKKLDGAPDLTVPVIQFEKDGAEDAGLVKIDLLGNRSLAVIRDAIEAVRVNTGRQIDYTSQEAGDDPATKALFRTGQTMGVFYTESPASRQLCAKSRADSFELLVLNTSIIRPASNRFIRQYLSRLHGEPYEPLHPVLRDTLAETFGIMVYQEDVVHVCQAYAGMSLADADGLRKSLQKKRPAKLLASYAQEFLRGARSLGRDDAVTEQVWQMVMSFSGYSFCKGHSASYIQVAQQACYLRANYPAEFMAAVLANGGGFYHPFAYVAEARRMGITILPPDVNASDFRTTGNGRELRIGLQFITSLSANGAEHITSARSVDVPPLHIMERGSGGEVEQRGIEAAGPNNMDPGFRRGDGTARRTLYRDLADLRVRTGLPSDDLRTLIKAGSCDSIANGMTRPMMLWMVDREAAGQRGSRAANVNGDAPLLFGPAAPPPRLPEYTAERCREDQYSALGFLIASHPMALYADRLRRFRLVRSPDLPKHVGQSVILAGMLTTAKPVHTAADEPMQFATFDDGDGLVEAVLFPEVYRTRGHVLFDQGPFLLKGKVEEEFGAITLTVTHLERVDRMLARLGA
ncbi:MAG TPA: DNA polymerase III subunit alpha, partial [Gemmatimonadales bacterium]|nr:DNA polymerase III subunit alpha [Gemmatimonadales bacterium]